MRVLGLKMPQKGRSRVLMQYGSIKATDLSSWSSTMPRSRGQSAYYELYCTCKLGEGLKKDFNEAIRDNKLKNKGETSYTSGETLE